MVCTKQEEIISRLSKLTIEMDVAEFELLRPIIDKEIKLEADGFKGYEDEVFYRAISEIGVKKIQQMVVEYNKRVVNIQSKISTLESKYDSLSLVPTDKTY